MDEQVTENVGAAPVLPTGTSEDGSPPEGSNTYTVVEGSSKTGNTHNDCDKLSSMLTSNSLGDRENEDNKPEREYRAPEHAKGASQKLKHAEDGERSPLSNMAAFSKCQRAQERFTDEDKDHIVDETHQMSPTSKECKVNGSLQEAEEQYVYFWQKHNPFSQWHSSSFQLDGKNFCCAEQYMMYTKAVLLHDDKLAKKIMECKDPSRIKSLGRKTGQFSEDLWVHNCLHVVKEGNMAKFRQNDHLKQKLFETYPRILVEASPYDKVWGIGLKKYEPCAWNEATWEGKNLLGYILTEVRDELLFESGFIPEDQRKVYLEELTNELVKDCSGQRGAYDRYPGHHYSGSYQDDISDGERRREHGIDYPRDEFSPVQGNDAYRRKRDGNTSREEGETSVFELNAPDFEDNSRKSQSNSSLTCYPMGYDDKIDQDDSDIKQQKESEAAQSETRLETKHETDISTKTCHEQGSCSRNVQCQKINKNEIPRCSKKENSEPNFRAVCTEPLEPEGQLYKLKCN